MVGIVVVSHSRLLAESAVELALQMAHGTPPPIEVAAGLEGGVLGTDAVRVLEAIERVASDDGVLVLMDLGSAVLSAELALDLRSGGAEDACPIVLSSAPLVEGLVAAVVLSAAGATLAEVAAEASGAADIKVKLLGGDAGPAVPASSEDDDWNQEACIELVLRNEHGLHARPAALLVETVRKFDAEVTVANVTTAGAPVNARSVSAVSTLGALHGHRVEVRARGAHAREALAAVSALVGRNFNEAVAPDASSRQPAQGPLPASPGVGIGPKLTLPPTAQSAAAGTAANLTEALDRTREDLGAIRARVASTVGEQEAAIFDAHLLLLEDQELVGEAERLVATGSQSPADAWTAAVEALAGRFEALADPYMRARAADVRGVGEQVLAKLVGTPTQEAPVLEGVLVAPDLTPAQAATLDPAHVRGIVLADGSPLSHAAILARSLGIPAVVAAGEDVLAFPDGTIFVVDGTGGRVVVDPSREILAEFTGRANAERAHATALAAAAHSPAVTRDGVTVHVVANVGSADDAALAVRNGADGVGLLRTEFLFLDRRQPPSEDEQLAAYTAVAEALGPRRLTVRTLDAGGDKPIPYLPASRSASALGCRGLRLSLEQPELFKVQLRALVRLGQHHPVTLLFPMVTTVDELAAARRFLEKAAVEAGCPAGTLPAGFEVGAMVEVPAFALHASAAADLVDVFSIGTNDLTQYTLAADRADPSVAHLTDPLNPAVLRLITEVAAAATSANVRVAVCGEVAGDPATTELLLGLGVRELSMSAPSIPAVKDAVRSSSGAGAAALARSCLSQRSAADVRRIVLEPPASVSTPDARDQRAVRTSQRGSSESGQ
jgi:phosphocarrier protein FPr